MTRINQPTPIVKQLLADIPQSDIDQLSLLLDYGKECSQPGTGFALLKYLAMHYSHAISSCSQSYDEISTTLLEHASSISETFANKLRALLSNHDFTSELQSQVEQIIDNDNVVIVQTSHTRQPHKNEPHKSSPEDKEKSKTPQTKPDKESQSKLKRQINNFQMRLNHNDHQTTEENCPSLNDKPQCICNIPRPINQDNEYAFRCKHCDRLYHTVCMKKNANAQYCAYCHLERMIPTSKVVSTVFITELRKSARKHFAKFRIPNIGQDQRVQIRCLRLKDGAQTACLFPDAAQILMNGQRCKIFEPINKQSSLKYRKDQPFTLIRRDFQVDKENTLRVSQVISPNRERQVRYEAENHILGVYIVEEKKLDNLIEEIERDKISNYNRSKAILDSIFRLQTGDEDITCQLVKISLLCPYIIERISIPVRGIFCTHFQCFDLRSYLFNVSKTQNPRWKCPICSSLAYEFEVDCILQAIINELKERTEVKEILFMRNGQFSQMIGQQPSTERKKISELDIASNRRLEAQEEEENLGRPRRRQFVMPENAQVIDLD